MKRPIYALAAALTLTGFFGIYAHSASYDFVPESAELKPGPGMETANRNCSVCHSVDYITTQPRGKGAGFWKSEVAKMVKVFGASVDPDDAGKIAAYLAANY